MKKIKIWFCDFWPNFSKKNNFIINLLKKHYEIECTPKTPDYLFYSNFGYDFLNYNSIKIFYTGENVFPNFNLCDYAIGCHTMEVSGSRYFRLPIYLTKKDQMVEVPERKILTKQDLKEKNKFCNFVYDNKKGNPFRKEFFERLNQYKKVDSAGKFLNNTGFVTKNKLALQKNYKFTIAFENEDYPEYCTEKIMDAFLTRTIPIYWGDRKVEKDFNPKAFIHCKNKKDVELVIDEVKKLDENEELWLEMANQPIFHEKNLAKNKVNQFEAFLISIIENKEKKIPKSWDAKNIYYITKTGSKMVNLKHKLHRLKVEKWN